jgi:formimidoylglutamate deiminase
MASVFLAEALLPDGWASNVRLLVEGGLIASVQPDAIAEPGDERHAVGIPGLSNLHSHAFQRGMAGLSEVRGPASDSFWTWREVMYRFLAAMTPEDVEAVTAQAYVEMLEGGFTRVGEFHYLHNAPNGQPYAEPSEMAQRVGAAAASSGIGLTLLPVFYAHGGFGGLPPAPGQRRFVSHLDEFARLLDASRGVVSGLDGSTLGVAPHSLRAVTPEELAVVAGLLPDGPVHIHIAEQVREVEDCLAWSGARPVEWLLDHATVDGRWCPIHATHMTPGEAARLAAAGAVAGLCPTTEANLGDGIFLGVDWLAAKGRYGVGTDSNVSADAAQELRQLEYAQRLGQRGRNLMAGEAGASTGRTLFDAALTGGAQALDAGPPGLRAGAAADLVTLRADHPNLVHRHGDWLLDGWIFGAGRGAMDGVWVRGRRRVTAGRHVAREAVAVRYAAALRRLMAA